MLQNIFLYLCRGLGSNDNKYFILKHQLASYPRGSLEGKESLSAH